MESTLRSQEARHRRRIAHLRLLVQARLAPAPRTVKMAHGWVTLSLVLEVVVHMAPIIIALAASREEKTTTPPCY